MSENESANSSLPSRRELLKAAPVAAGALSMQTAAAQGAANPAKPNIVIVFSDQFRGDCLGGAGHPMKLTPNLDEMAARGTMFKAATCSQPVCAPARASILTGQYPSKHGVFKNAITLDTNAVTFPKEMRKAGYTANHIGKWHLGDRTSLGPVAPDQRGGFLDLWQSSNVLESTSHPYEGDLFDGDGKAMHFSNIYRTDYMTGLAQKFLR